MNVIRFAVLTIIFFAHAPVFADYIDSAKKWTKPWKGVKKKHYRIGLNTAGEAGFGIGKMSISFPNIKFKWQGKSHLSLHHNLHGTGPWKKIKATHKKEKNGDDVFELEGTVADLKVNKKIIAGENEIIYRYNAEVISPSASMYIIHFDGNLSRCHNVKFSCVANSGKVFNSAFNDAFKRYTDLKKITLYPHNYTIIMSFNDVRSLLIERFDSYKHIPARYLMHPGGVPVRKLLMPGDKLYFDIHVKIIPPDEKNEKPNTKMKEPKK